MSRLYLIDVSSICHWLYHARGPEFDPAGLPCGMLLGVHDWFLDFHAKYNPTHVAAVFDGFGNWRTERYVEYKANRKAKPKDEDLIAQLRLIPNELARLGVPCVKYDGFEADDVIGAIAAWDSDLETVIVTSDKDLCQLVTDRCLVYDPRGEKLFDAAAVLDKHGVPPHRLREMLALMGDTSDNVPGVEGWGKVRAINAINQTRSLPEMVRKARAGSLTGINAASQTALAAAHDSGELALWYELVGLRYDVPMIETLDDLVMASPGQCLKSDSSAA